jgi:hypothetical protein
MAQKPPAPPNLTIRDARFQYQTNFEGRATDYKDAGERMFNVQICGPDVCPDIGLADILTQDGWNIKWTKPHKEATQEEKEAHIPMPFLPVKVGYAFRPPAITLIGGTSGKETELGEETVGMLDHIEVQKVDMIIRAVWYDVNGSTGWKAYLQTMFITMVEDELQLEYAKKSQTLDESHGLG